MTEQMTEKAVRILKEISPDYKLLKLIGQGSVGSVYECKNSESKHIAVKLMETNPMMDDKVFESIIDAALATRKIPENVNVVRVLKAGRKGNFFYIEMDMMQGGTLENIVLNPGISFEKKIKIAADIAKTLADIHKRGIVHGDLKPANVLISEDNVPYLNDFYLFPNRSAGVLPSMPLGTPYYMSPEQAKGTLITTASDIYSFGILIYELLTGKMPYESIPENIQEMINIINDGKIIPPSKFNPEINNKTEAVMLKLLEKKPSERYHHMNTVAEDLLACLDNKPVSIPYKLTFIEKIYSLFSHKNNS